MVFQYVQVGGIIFLNLAPRTGEPTEVRPCFHYCLWHVAINVVLCWLFA